jgi:hypothetical protein
VDDDSSVLDGPASVLGKLRSVLEGPASISFCMSTREVLPLRPVPGSLPNEP